MSDGQAKVSLVFLSKLQDEFQASECEMVVGGSVMRRQKGMVVDASAREEKTRRAPPLGQHLAGLFGLVLPLSIYFRLFVACRARATGLERRPVGLQAL